MILCWPIAPRGRRGRELLGGGAVRLLAEPAAAAALSGPRLRGAAAPVELARLPLLMACGRADWVGRGSPGDAPGGGRQPSFPVAFRASTMQACGIGRAGSQKASPLPSQCLRIATCQAGFPDGGFSRAQSHLAFENLVNVISRAGGPQGFEGLQVSDQGSRLQVAAIVVTVVHFDEEMTIAFQERRDLWALPKTG